MAAPEFHIPTPGEMANIDPAVREAAAAAFLGTLDLSGRVSLDLFKQRVRWTTPTVDLVPLIHDKDTDTFSVPLARRPEDDPWWAGQLHVTGSALLGIDFSPEHGEQNYKQIATRIGRTELHSSFAFIDGPYELYTRPRVGPRGTELTTFLVGGAEQRADLPEGVALYPAPEIAENPPDGGFIIGHAETVIRAVKLYGQHLSGERPLLPAFGPPL